ncbi:MAG: hypothetical protein A2X45_23535 [Lentisphaerae bacterium GWF2_50_93]|nr:MAG: hypothetical protein A2X45_23535 [Lentisphaerae bacterium GWF2_50_93]
MFSFNTEILIIISRILIIPVFAMLFVLLIWAFLELGGYARECIERRRNKRNWTAFVEKLIAAKDEDTLQVARSFFDRTEYPGFVSVFAAKGAHLVNDTEHLGKTVADIEIEASHGHQRMNLGIRLGPALGLIGTLIPMGPALLGLSAGNVASIAGNLAAAFGTTILGLGVSTICYFISIGRRHWYAKDLSDIEYVYHFLSKEGVHDAGQKD